MRQLHDREQQAKAERLTLAEYFQEAYVRFPVVPRGSLEAIAYVASRWHHLRPEEGKTHGGKPRPSGVMGLHDGQGGFADLVSEAATAFGTSAAAVKQDPRTNILATAALLQRWTQERLGGPGGITDLVPELGRLSGIVDDGGPVTRHLLNSHAYDILLHAQKGVTDAGYAVPAQPVDWPKAFSPKQLAAMQSPLVHIDAKRQEVRVLSWAEVEETGPVPHWTGEETGTSAAEVAAPVDAAAAPKARGPEYGEAVQFLQAVHYDAGRYGQRINGIAIHDMEGSYAGSISWFLNPKSEGSAHYMLRSSDGQITQMVRESDSAWHLRGGHNSRTIGIEHEKYKGLAGARFYTPAMYNASARLARHLCVKYQIDCAKAYRGPAHSGLYVLPDSYTVKGHQHFSGNDHTDPGIDWNWAHYFRLLNPTIGGADRTVLDDFATGAGHFDTAPTFSGSTVGIAPTSSAVQGAHPDYEVYDSQRMAALKVTLVDDSSVVKPWEVRLLSGMGDPRKNTPLPKPGGRIGFWVYALGDGMSVAVTVDDADGTERSIRRSVPAKRWTFVEWKLDSQAEWDGWAGGNGVINGTATLDALWFFRDDRRADGFPGTAVLFVDDVTYRRAGLME